MLDRLTLQDIINSSFKVATEKENELIEKCKKYKKSNSDKSIIDLFESFAEKAQQNMDRIPYLAEKLALNQNSKKKIILTQIDKLQVILKDKIELQKLYNEFSIKNQNPEVRKLFVLLRDTHAEDIYYLQQKIQQIIYTERPITKSIK